MGHRSSPEKASKNKILFLTVQDGGPLTSVLLRTQLGKTVECHPGKTHKSHKGQQLKLSQQVDTCLMPLAVASKKNGGIGKLLILRSSQNLPLPTGQRNVGKEWLGCGYHWQVGPTQFSLAA